MKKREMFTTATALISCAKFKQGDIVSVKYECHDEQGVDWYLCNDSVVYPENHLTHFVI
jgi:hypothetical protein